MQLIETLYRRPEALGLILVLSLTSTAAAAQAPAASPAPSSEVPATVDSTAATDTAPFETTAGDSPSEEPPQAATGSSEPIESPAASPPVASPCTSDNDCSDEKICEQGRCITSELNTPPLAVSPQAVVESSEDTRKISAVATDLEGVISIYFPLVIYWRTDSGYDFFSTASTFLSPGVGFDVDFLTIKKRWRFSAGAFYLTEHLVSRNVNGLYDTSYMSQSVSASIRARVRLLRWLSPEARIYAGASFNEVKVDQYRQDWTPGFKGGAGLGVLIHTPSLGFKNPENRMPVFSAGMLLEGGFEFGNPLEVELDMSEDGEHPIEVVNSPSGTLSRNAPFLRLEFFLRF